MVNDLSRRVPSYVRRDDLLSAGLLGLAQAVKTFDPTREAKFATFARTRINGALLDELRSRDWASRGVRAKVRVADAAAEALESVLGRTPTAAEVAQALGTATADVHRLQADLHRATVLSLDGAMFDSDNQGPIDLVAVYEEHADPSEILAGRELRAYVRDAVNQLPERLRQVVIGYFIEERPMADIAEELGVTESRVSHMRSEAVALMGEAIRSAMDEKPVAPDPTEKLGVASRRRAAYCASVASATEFRARIAANASAAGSRASTVGA